MERRHPARHQLHLHAVDGADFGGEVGHLAARQIVLLGEVPIVPLGLWDQRQRLDHRRGGAAVEIAVAFDRVLGLHQAYPRVMAPPARGAVARRRARQRRREVEWRQAEGPAKNVDHHRHADDADDLDIDLLAHPGGQNPLDPAPAEPARIGGQAVDELDLRRAQPPARLVAARHREGRQRILALAAERAVARRADLRRGRHAAPAVEPGARLGDPAPGAAVRLDQRLADAIGAFIVDPGHDSSR